MFREIPEYSRFVATLVLPKLFWLKRHFVFVCLRNVRKVEKTYIAVPLPETFPREQKRNRRLVGEDIWGITASSPEGAWPNIFLFTFRVL